MTIQELMKLHAKTTAYIDNLWDYARRIRELNPDEEVKSMYAYVKSIIPEFYINGVMHIAYESLIDAVLECESCIPKTFIIESKPNFTPTSNISLRFDSDTIFLDSLVNKIRKTLITAHTFCGISPNIDDLDFENDCRRSSNMVQRLCNSLNIESHTVAIWPGYSKEAKLYDGNGFHFFNIIKYNKRYYLIDLTYRQFFTRKWNFLERIGIVNLSGCRPGTFMIMKDTRRAIAYKILKDGWIEITEEVLKSYLDGFSISFRNGLYYEQTNDYSYETNYTVDDYLRFLTGDDNQINHESKEVLGYQRRPLSRDTQ